MTAKVELYSQTRITSGSGAGGTSEKWTARCEPCQFASRPSASRESAEQARDDHNGLHYSDSGAAGQP